MGGLPGTGTESACTPAWESSVTPCITTICQETPATVPFLNSTDVWSCQLEAGTNSITSLPQLAFWGYPPGELALPVLPGHSMEAHNVSDCVLVRGFLLSASTVSSREQSPRVPSSRMAMQWMLGREVSEDVMPVVLCCGKGHCATCHLNGVNQEEKLLLTSSCYRNYQEVLWDLTWPAIAPWFWAQSLPPHLLPSLLLGPEVP